MCNIGRSDWMRWITIILIKFFYHNILFKFFFLQLLALLYSMSWWRKYHSTRWRMPLASLLSYGRVPLFRNTMIRSTHELLDPVPRRICSEEEVFGWYSVSIGMVFKESSLSLKTSQASASSVELDSLGNCDNSLEENLDNRCQMSCKYNSSSSFLVWYSLLTWLKLSCRCKSGCSERRLFFQAKPVY